MAIAVVQAVAKNALTNTITAPVSGNGLIVCIDSFNSTTATITSVKLGTTNLTLAVTKNQGGDGATQSWIYYLPNVPSGQTSVVITGSGLQVDSTNGGVDIIEASGLLTSSPLDKAPVGGGGTGTSWSSASSGTLSQANELVIGTATGFSMSSPSGWTMVSGGGTGRRTGYKIVAATTAQTFASTMSSADWSALIATFKASSASAINPATAAVASML